MQSQVHHSNSPKKLQSNSLGLNANGSNLNLKFSDLSSNQDSTIDETKPLYIDELGFPNDLNFSLADRLQAFHWLISRRSNESLKILLKGSKQSSTSELEYNNSLQSHVYVDWNGPTEHARQKQELTDSDNDGQ